MRALRRLIAALHGGEVHPLMIAVGCMTGLYAWEHKLEAVGFVVVGYATAGVMLLYETIVKEKPPAS